jgi:hypothetical protein
MLVTNERPSIPAIIQPDRLIDIRLYHEFRTRQSFGDLRFEAGHFGMLKKVSEPFVR